MSNINIVLFEPQIHANTGNIARSCAVTGASLHLVKPLGFSLDDRHLKRAGLDYWDKLDIHYYENTNEFLSLHEKDELYFFSSKGRRYFSDVRYPENVYLIFGKEDTGLSDKIIEKYSDRCLRIPMREGVRCLNLSNSAAIALYEVLRQRGYTGLV